MTPLEKRLARRIHNQRVRLRQLEDFKSWGSGIKDREFKRSWMKLAIERGKEIKRLKGES